MEDSDFKNINSNYDFNPDLAQSQQTKGNLQSQNQENELNNMFETLLKKNEAKGVIETSKKVESTPLQKNLDSFIQESLNKYKPLEHPDPSLYSNTTEDEKDLVISKKSTIPDLVIWNKTFNKNDCYVDADKMKNSDFPRFRFYLRLGNKDKNGKNKNEKNKKKEKKNKKNKKDKNNNLTNTQDINDAINNLTMDMNNLNIKNDINDNNNINKNN